MKRKLLAGAIITPLMLASAPAFAWVDALVAIAWTVNVSFLGATTYEQANGPILAEAEVVPGNQDQTATVNGLEQWTPEVANELLPEG